MTLAVDLMVVRRYSGAVDTKVATVLLTMIACVCGLAGCTRRMDLAPPEFDSLHKLDPELGELRVYLGRRLWSYYPQLGDNAMVDVTRRKVRVRGERRPHERRIVRATTGKIVKIDTLNGMTRFWVNFFSECQDVSCAYGFVQTELQRYSLVSVPALEKYEAPISYRRTRLKRNKLRMLRQRSLAEANEVMAAPRRKGKAKPINLQIRKDKWRPTRKTREKADGV